MASAACICGHPRNVHEKGVDACKGKTGLHPKTSEPMACTCTTFEQYGLCQCGHQLNHHPAAGAFHDEENKPTRACNMTVPGKDPVTDEDAEIPCPCTKLRPKKEA